MSSNTWEIHSEAATIGGVALKRGDVITDGTDTQTVMLFVATSLTPPVIFPVPNGGASRIISFDQFLAGWAKVDGAPHPLKAGIVALDIDGQAIIPIQTPPAPMV